MWRVNAPAVAGLLLLGGVPAAAEESGMVLEEITVTAQRRQQNLAEVPISISTLDSEQLDYILEAGDDIRALATRVPSLYAESSNGRVAPRFYIRGLGNTDFDLAASQPVSVVVDEVVQENVILKSFPLFDIERVEVLKGPQGTLFGRNTPAGIVKLDTVKPDYDPSGYASLTFAPDDAQTTIFEGAVGGGLIDDKLAGRVSLLYQDRKDWIDNGFTGESNALGGFEELAFRGQLLWDATERLSFLGNLHFRELDGTASVFRANIVGDGSSKLNDNFSRDEVFFDEGDNNPQSYDSIGGSLRIDYDFDSVTFTSITAVEQTDGSSLGDIDGGSGSGDTANPPPIPFNSQTEDGIDDLDQFTQEFRFSHVGETLNWQAGLYFFDSEFTISTNPFFAPASTVTHSDKSWAIFGQVGYDFTERFNLTAGLRYTDDEKELDIEQSNIPADVLCGPENSLCEASDDEISWDLAALFRVNESVNLFARLARGYRAPSIQGRDIAFFGFPSVADSEKITSFDIGVKADVNDRLRINAALFYYEIRDQQFTAVGGEDNLVQLLNADKGVGQGFEADITWLPVDGLVLTLGYSYNDTEIRDDALRIDTCGSGICTVLDPLDDDGFAIVDGNAFPQAPEHIVYATAGYMRPVGNGGELFGQLDYAYQGETSFFIYEAAEYIAGEESELGLRLGYRRADGSWEIALFGRNITDNEILRGGIDFNNNTGFVNEPRIWGANFRIGF